MLLKKHYDAKGAVTHVDVQHTGTHDAQSWGAKHVSAWVEEGWMRVDGDSIVIVTGDGQPDLIYAIKRRPGYYCADTGERVPISDLALTQFMSQSVATLAPREAVAWLKGKGRSGKYAATRNYECVLDAKQHAQFKGA